MRILPCFLYTSLMREFKFFEITTCDMTSVWIADVTFQLVRIIARFLKINASSLDTNLIYHSSFKLQERSCHSAPANPYRVSSLPLSLVTFKEEKSQTYQRPRTSPLGYFSIPSVSSLHAPSPRATAPVPIYFDSVYFYSLFITALPRFLLIYKLICPPPPLRSTLVTFLSSFFRFSPPRPSPVLLVAGQRGN